MKTWALAKKMGSKITNAKGRHMSVKGRCKSVKFRPRPLLLFLSFDISTSSIHRKLGMTRRMVMGCEGNFQRMVLYNGCMD